MTHRHNPLAEPLVIPRGEIVAEVASIALCPERLRASGRDQYPTGVGVVALHQTTCRAMAVLREARTNPETRLRALFAREDDR